MKFRKILAVVPESSVEKIEEDLKALGVSGMTLSKKHGMGEYRNFYTEDQMVDCMEITVYTEESKANKIALSIMKSAHKGLDSDGMLAILPVEELYHIKEFSGSQSE